MGMFEVKDQVYGFMGIFSGRWFGSEV